MRGGFVPERTGDARCCSLSKKKEPLDFLERLDSRMAVVSLNAVDLFAFCVDYIFELQNVKARFCRPTTS